MASTFYNPALSVKFPFINSYLFANYSKLYNNSSAGKSLQKWNNHNIKSILTYKSQRAAIYVNLFFISFNTYPLSWCTLSLLHFKGVSSVLKQWRASIGLSSSKNSKNFCSIRQNLIFFQECIGHSNNNMIL